MAEVEWVTAKAGKVEEKPQGEGKAFEAGLETGT
jgi:hypothetical protein